MDAVPLIHNPAAGGGRGLLRLREAEALLAVKGVTVRAIPTERPGHATGLARDLAAEGHRRLLVLGGDGTLSEAANGILGLPAGRRPELGFLPAGTGNDFLRDFGVLDLATAAQGIALGRVTAVDAARVTWPGGSRFIINVLGTGLAAKAGDRCNRQFKWLGRKGYDVAAMVELARMRETPTRLVLDGVEIHGDFPLIMACNSVHTGGAMKMAPAARPTDGLLDVLTVEGVGSLGLLGLLTRHLRKGTHVRHPGVKIRRAARLRIEPRDPSPLLLDGEVMGTTPVEAEVIPGALRLLA
ncbi:MAG TPA: diacylglycerol kinase family protein [Candidatus Thermoplasmatota archaeon]|nr:diacylglycerol kinase family protein [Candidatus Thermoplasmatota archaeon]